MIEEEDYRPNLPDAQGILQSRIFPGLRLELPALLAMNAAQVLDGLERGLATQEHLDFVARLKR